MTGTLDVATLAEDFGHRLGVSRIQAARKLKKVVGIMLENMDEGKPVTFSVEMKGGKVGTVAFTKTPDEKILVHRVEHPPSTRPRTKR